MGSNVIELAAYRWRQIGDEAAILIGRIENRSLAVRRRGDAAETNFEGRPGRRCVQRPDQRTGG